MDAQSTPLGLPVAQAPVRLPPPCALRSWAGDSSGGVAQAAAAASFV